MLDKPKIMYCGTTKLTFTVLGDPHGQMRARFNRFTGRAYDPKGSVEAKANVRAIATMAMLDQGINLMHKDMPVEMQVISYRPIPRSKPLYYKRAAELGIVAPLEKPDATNILKEIEDSLLGVVYVDDKQIFKESYEARYSDQPRAEVTIIGYFVNIGEIKDKVKLEQAKEKQK